MGPIHCLFFKVGRVDSVALSVRVLDKDVAIVSTLPVRSAIRLTHNLMRIIEINHDVSEAVTDMPIASVLPWILLYRIIRQ